MGLDIYAGTLTRYYSGNWKTIMDPKKAKDHTMTKRSFANEYKAS